MGHLNEHYQNTAKSKLSENRVHPSPRASNHSATNEVPSVESQQTAMVQPMPMPQQEANVAPLASPHAKSATDSARRLIR